MVAKGALEGHCIYEGGFCKLHITYSRHTDLSIKVSSFTKVFSLYIYSLKVRIFGLQVNNDRSRDYTMPDPAVAMAPQPGHNPYPSNSPQYQGADASHYQQQQPQGGWGQQSGGQGHNPYMGGPPSMHQGGPGGYMPPHHYGSGPSGPMH